MAKKSTKPDIPKGYSSSGDKTYKLTSEEYFYKDMQPSKPPKTSKAKAYKP
mgnify:CR=1 FL=1